FTVEPRDVQYPAGRVNHPEWGGRDRRRGSGRFPGSAKASVAGVLPSGRRPRPLVGCRRGPGGPGASAPAPPAPRAGSERLQRRLLVLLDAEKLVQASDLEHLVNLRADVAKNQFAARVLDLLVEGDEFSEGGAGEVLDVAEVQQQFRQPVLLHEGEQLLTDVLNILLFEYLLVHEIDDGDIADRFHLETAAAGLCRHA